MLSRLMTRREQFVIGFLGLAIFAGAAGLFWSKRAVARPEPPMLQPKPEAVPAPAPKEALPPPPAREIAVSVQGAVGKPGVYRLSEDSRVDDLIKAAGGLRDANTSDINLAARLIDGTTLVVPKHGDAVDDAQGSTHIPALTNPATYTVSGQGAAASTAAAPGGGDSGLIDINRATQSELETLPGIGPKLAQQIIQYRSERPFGDISEMMEVPGIGPQRFEAIRELITTE